MSNAQLKGNFEQIKGQIKEKWGQLTDNEIDSLKGNWDQLAGKLVERYGMAKDKAEYAANDFLKSIKAKTGDDSGGDGSGAGDLGSITNQLSETVENAKENIAAASETFVTYVKENPVTAMSIALIGGAILALLMRR
jgi:uncharacterized protein YjbJ (UPF0337 family)